MYFAFPNVWVGDEVTGLRKKEWLLLRYMHEHRGELVTPNQIYQEVWGYHPSTVASFGDGAIRTVISRIRTEVPDVIIARAQNLGWVLV